ncbi:hypothetical protein BDF14DRAFT_1793454 [Spinellus fusiger]|nr:hypothetical protein BDF14DRAFT_1793454 [Spinellus fusiger]
MNSIIMQVVYSDDCLLHNPENRLARGEFIASSETPSRLVSIKRFIDNNPEFDVVEPNDYGFEPIVAAHEEEYIQFLSTIHSDWEAAGFLKDNVFSEIYCHNSAVEHLDRATLKNTASKSVMGRIGLHTFDMAAPFDKNTWKSTYVSAQTAISAAHRLLVQSENNKNASLYALCRPPGHHATHSAAGGFCYINNVAVVAKFLQNYNIKEMESLKKPLALGYDPTVPENIPIVSIKSKHRKIMIIDVDYHHGNGTQAIFYDDPSVLYISLHGSPSYPFFSGSEEEKGRGEGLGYNINVPLDPFTTTDAVYLENLKRVLSTSTAVDFNADIVICSLGLDTWYEDPLAGMKNLVHVETYATIGELLHTSPSCNNRPMLFVQEGGYTIEKLGELAGNVLKGYLNAKKNTVNKKALNSHY